MASKRELQLIRIACQRRWLTAEQGEECLFVKRKLGDKLTIEQILRQRRYLTDDELAELSAAAGASGRRRPAVGVGADPADPADPAVPGDPTWFSGGADGPPTTEEAPVDPSTAFEANGPDDRATALSPVYSVPRPPIPAPSTVSSPVGRALGAPTVIAHRDQLFGPPAHADPPPAPPTSSPIVRDAQTVLVPAVRGPRRPPPRPPSERLQLDERGDPIIADVVPAPSVPQALDDLPGVFGPYRIRHLIARGKRTAVYRATHEDSGRDVALKVLLAADGAAAAFVSGRADELVAAAQIEHPHVVRVLDVGRIEGRYYVALDFVPGWALDDKLAAGDPVSLVAAVALVHDIAGALAAAAGRGTIHGDIAPKHVLVDHDGQARLTGFGFYSVYRGRRGTPGFMAPEVAAGEPPSPLGDQFSLGALMFLLAVSRPPYDAINDAERMRITLEMQPPDPRLFRPDLPPDVASLILRLMAREPQDRFASFEAVVQAARAVREALADIAAPAPVEALRPVLGRAVAVTTALVAIALAVPAALDLAGLAPAAGRWLRSPVALLAALALTGATLVHAVLALIRRGELPLPLSSAWLVRGQEMAGLTGAALLVAGFVVAPPAHLNLALALAGIAILFSGVWGLFLRWAVAEARADGGVGRVLAVLGDPRLARWRNWHVPALTTLAAVAVVRWMALAYFAAS